MLGEYTQESSYYDVIRYDKMAITKSVLCTSIVYQLPVINLQQVENMLCHYRLYLLPNYKLESTLPTIVSPKLTQQRVFQIQVEKYFMFFAAYVQ